MTPIVLVADTLKLRTVAAVDDRSACVSSKLKNPSRIFSHYPAGQRAPLY